jgi:tetratricopeptide (TPR) repeat protein
MSIRPTCLLMSLGMFVFVGIAGPMALGQAASDGEAASGGQAAPGGGSDGPSIKDGKLVIPAQHEPPGGVEDASGEDAASDGQVAPEAAPISRDSRHYEQRRLRSLEEHERFEFGHLPPGQTVHTWREHPARRESYDLGFEDGYAEGWRAAQHAISVARGASVYDEAMEMGEGHFRERDYGSAVRDFLLAATVDQGDPMCRLRAAHSMTALGHYDDAAMLIKRAFELQPKLVYVPFDMRRLYNEGSELSNHVARLEKHVDAMSGGDAMSGAGGDDPARTRRANTLALLGYYRYYSGDASGAHRVLTQARSISRRDRFINALLEAARVSAPAANPYASPSEKGK